MSTPTSEVARSPFRRPSVEAIAGRSTPSFGLSAPLGILLVALGSIVAASASTNGARQVEPIVGIVVTAVVCIASWRRGSVLVAIYVALAGVGFFLSPVVLALTDSRFMVQPPLIAVGWVATLGAVPLLLRRSPREALSNQQWESSGVTIRWTHYAIGCLVVAIHMALAVGGQLGYRAQLESGITSGSGIPGLLADSAAPYVLFLFAAKLASGQKSPLVVALFIAELAALVITGFRGAGVTLALAIGVVYIVVRGRHAVRLSLGRAVGLILIVAGLSLGAFIGAAEVKKDIADSSNAQSAGNRVWNLDESLEQLGGRLNSSSYFRASIPFSDQSDLGSLSWSSQASFIIPRAVWPDKPSSNYGQEVTDRVYGLVGVKSSSTISTLGDVHLNVGPIGVIATALGLGLGLVAIERRARTRPTLFSLAALSVAAIMICNQEQPLALMLVGFLRSLLVVGALWFSANRLSRIGMKAARG